MQSKAIYKDTKNSSLTCPILLFVGNLKCNKIVQQYLLQNSVLFCWIFTFRGKVFLIIEIYIFSLLFKIQTWIFFELYSGNICWMANFHFHQRLILISDGRPTDFTIISADDTPVMETDEVSIWVFISSLYVHSFFDIQYLWIRLNL